MASTKIDELQINIGSDASDAIRQLGNLAAALNVTATAASRLTSATGSLNGLANAITKLAGADTKTAISNIQALSSASKALKSKKVNISIAVNGLDQVKQLKDIAMPSVGDIKLKDTGITTFVNAMKRLSSVDTSKFDTTFIDKMKETIQMSSELDGIDKSVTKFVSAFSRLAKVGYGAARTAAGLEKLTPILQNVMSEFAKIGSINDSITSALTSLAQLASVGKTAEESASGLSKLTPQVIRLLQALKAIPISDNMAQTIQGLGQLAAAGSSVGKELDRASASSDKLARSIVNITVDTVTNSLKGLLRIALSLGKQGVAALGSFLSKLHLIPSLSGGIDRTTISFGNLLRSILPFVGIKGIFGWAKESFEAGSSIVELQNVIDTAFGSIINGYRDISGYIYNWSKDTIDAFGVSELAAQRYAGRLMSMFNSSSFDANEKMRDSAAKMTTDLIERAGDIASFYDISVDQAMTKMTAAMAGMTRPMRALGVNMNVANLEAYAMSQGINQSWQEMDQATQMAVRYQYMLNATRYAEGDFAATSKSAANQVRLLQLNTQMLSATMGQGLVSAIAPVIGWLNALIKRLIQAAVAFRTFMWTLFGKPLAAAKGLLNETADYLDDATGAASDLGNAGGGAADGLGSAGKAAKELKKQLTVLPFDELNQLAKDTESAGSGGSGGGGGGGGVGGLGDMSGLGLLPDLGAEVENSPVADAINKWAAKIRAAFDAKDWKLMGLTIADGLNEGLAKLYDVLDWAKWEPTLKGFIQPFQTVVNFMVEGIDWPLLGRTFARGLNLITKTFRLWINGFNWRNYGKKFALGMNGFLGEWDADAFGRAIVDKFRAAWNFFGGWIEKFNFKLLGTKLKEGVLGALDELDWEDMGNSLAGLFNGISDTIIEFFEDGEVSDKLADSFVELVNGFLEKFDSEKAKKAMESIKKSLQKVISKAISNIDKTELASDIGNLLIGLPWGFIAAKLGVHVGGALAIGLFGSAFKKSATTALSNVISSKLGIGAAGKAGASGASASAASGASAGAGIGVGGALAGAGGIGAALGFGLWMRHMAEKNGGIQQFDGKNLAPSTQTTVVEKQKENNTALSNKGMNAAGQYTSIQSPTPTNTQSTNTVKTVMTGEKDPSFTLLERAKAALMANPVIKKLMDGETSKKFDTGYGKYTDTKSYKSTKVFDANPLAAFKTWWSRNIDTKNYKSNKSMNATIGNPFSTWWSRNTDTKNYKSNKSMTATIGDKLSTWYPRYTDTGKYTATKSMGANIGRNLSNWYPRYTDTGHYTATKYMKAADAGKFLSFTAIWQSIKDKWVDINVSIVKKTADLGAWIKGKWEELVSFRWFAKGGMFTGPTAINVFGEAGDEAAIPLERKSTMKRIGSAIANAGGMGNSNSDEIADAIAIRVIPAIAQMMSNQNQRPIAVNAVLYTENDEVLARSVNRGQRILDKRYNPVSQFSY